MDRTLSAVELADALEPILCTTCHGFGDVRNAPCPTCKGAGLVARDLSLDERRAASDHLRRSAPPAEVREVVDLLRAGALVEAQRLQPNSPVLARALKERDVRWKAADMLESLSAQEARNAALEEWQPMETAPRDGTPVDLWFDGARLADCYWGKPDHTCGEAGEHCDNHPLHDGWCDVFGYVEGCDEDSSEPTHWRPLPAPPAITKGAGNEG